MDCSFFALKFGGILQNTEIHLFRTLPAVGGFRQAEKWLEPENSPEIRGFCSLVNPKKRSVNLFDHHCKGRVFKNIFFWKVCFDCLF